MVQDDLDFDPTVEEAAAEDEEKAAARNHRQLTGQSRLGRKLLSCSQSQELRQWAVLAPDWLKKI